MAKAVPSQSKEYSSRSWRRRTNSSTKSSASTEAAVAKITERSIENPFVLQLLYSE
jgi:hypothetical protein